MLGIVFAGLAEFKLGYDFFGLQLADGLRIREPDEGVWFVAFDAVAHEHHMHAGLFSQFQRRHQSIHRFSLGRVLGIAGRFGCVG